MNKKIILYYFLIALIVIISITDPSYAALVYNNMMFSPGYDSGIPGPLGTIPVESAAVLTEYDGNDNSPVYEYGMMKMKFNDPKGFKLQQYTGANGWRLDVVGDSILTNIF